MLVCNVSLRPRRRAISSGIAEVATAVDALGTGNIVFAALVDDPASVRETVDAYLGEIMLEAASADTDVNAGLIYATGVDEAVTAIAVQDAAVPAVYSDTVTEAATAIASPDASIAAAAAVTTTGAGPLLAMDSTFPASKLTVITAGR